MAALQSSVPLLACMTEQEFDSLTPKRPFRREELAQIEADAGRFRLLGAALWGRRPAHLDRLLEVFILKFRRDVP